MTLDALIQKTLENFPQADPDLIRRAYALAEEAHAGQYRASGELYVMHPLATALILAEMRLDPVTIAAALLHDVPEDTAVSLERIQKEFGPEVTQLVNGVTKLSAIEWGSLEQGEAESLRKMFLAMAEDVRVVLIKLADRLHNMRTLDALLPASRKRVASETLEIFAPLANRLGIWNIKSELEDLAFKHLEPDKYQELAALVAEQGPAREAYVQQVVAVLQTKLREEGLRAHISGRPKHIYSIYKKMQEKGRDFGQIYDVRAVRIIVDDTADCYATLGIVHSLWRPIPGEIDDYIATPKDNNYQSLHTAVIGPEGKPLEVQIRTWEMHYVAEYGIATHWRYKEGLRRQKDIVENRLAWLRQLLEWRKDVADAQEFVDSLKTDIFPDQVYVFTPKWKVIDLPAGATPIDFAYAIHTEIGDRCRGAKVHGRLVSLDYRLRNGDQIEIITAKSGGPSLDWLNPNLGYVKTSRAREKIRQWFRRQNRADALTQGRELLERDLRRFGLQHENFERIAKFAKYATVEEFLVAVGYGDVNPQVVIARLLESEQVKEEKIVLPTAPPTTEAVAGITVGGVSDLLTNLARCCNPVPGDAIVGYVTQGRGITVHRRDCPNMRSHKNKERLLQVAWGQAEPRVYPASIRILAYDRPGLIRDISDIVAGEGVNMSAAHATTTKKDHKAIITATLEVNHMGQLSRILTKVGELPNVLEAVRQTN